MDGFQNDKNRCYEHKVYVILRPSKFRRNIRLLNSTECMLTHPTFITFTVERLVKGLFRGQLTALVKKIGATVQNGCGIQPKQHPLN